MDDQLNTLEQSQLARREMLAKWRASHKHELTLPSGLKVVVRDVTITDLMFTGKLPDVFLDMVDEANQQNSTSVDVKKLTQNAAEFEMLVNTMVKLAVVEPAIADVADDDHISLAELSGNDKMFIFNWANREVDQLRPFREGEAAPVAAVQPGNGLRKTPKRNGASRN